MIRPTLPSLRIGLIALCGLVALLGPGGRGLAAERRVALVVGVSAYRHAPALPNTRNDASAVGDALRRLGFQVQGVLDPERADLEAAVRRFGDAARGADAAVFFYAGHALEVGGRNWLLPVGMQIAAPRDLRFEALDLDGLLEQTDGAARVAVLFLDACRDNPFQKALATGSRAVAAGGLGQVSAGAGTLVAFATAPGTVAADGEGDHSPFTAALLRHIETPGLELRQMLGLVRRDVRAATRGAQVPWENASLEGAFYFKPGPAPQGRPGPARDTGAEADLLFWQSIKDSTEASDFAAYLSRFPDGTFAALARRRAALGAPVAAPGTAAPTPPQAKPAASPPGAAAQDVAASPLYQALMRRIEEIAPGLARPDDRVRSYVHEAGHKALALSDNPLGSWRLSGAASAEDARTGALQSCQLRNGAPCILIATDDRVETRPAGGWPRRDFEEMHYAGPFDPAKIPVSAARREREDVAGYRALTGPKAAALHPWRRLFIAGGASQAEAETGALASCNADPVRQGRDGPCLLYAAGDRVVLGQRRTVALTGPVADPPPGRPEAPPRPASAEAALRDQLLTLGREAGAASAYARLPGQKALAVQVESGRTFSWSAAKTEPVAEQSALESCQLRYGTPCTLVASGDALQGPDPRALPRGDMPRLAYAGPYRPEMVPFPLARQAQDREAYAGAPGPKAMAIHVPRGVFWASGATPTEAQARALSACNEPDPVYPCFLYAVGDRVMLPQRRTEADR